jgi:glutamate carboxypeptidase
MNEGTHSAARTLRDHLAGRRDEMVALLVELARAESPSREPAAQEQPLKLLRSALEDRGFRVRRIPGRATGGHLLAIPASRTAQRTGKQRASVQLLLGHCDTVWPLGTLRNMPVEQRDGKLYGPGVYDMKAGLVQAIFAIDALRRTGVVVPIVPIMFVNSDEEIGSPESTPHIRRLARAAERVFVVEPSLGPTGQLKTARKGVGRYTIRVTGRAAHAGLDPGQGISAILELSHVVQALFALNDAQRGISVNVGTIDGGLRPNVVAPEARAEADVRVLTQEDAERMHSAIQAIEPSMAGTHLEITGCVGRPPLERTPANRQLWEAAR